MDVNSHEVLIQLRAIKRWIAVGSLGFLLIGGAVLVFSISLVSLMHTTADEISKSAAGTGENDDFDDQASSLFEQGKVDALMKLVTERVKEFPNDADVYWYRARAHQLSHNWPDALTDLRQAAFLAPSWKAEYTDPLMEEITRRMASK